MRTTLGIFLACLIVNFLAAVDAPERLVARTQGNDAIALTWDAVTGVDALVVQRSSTGGGWKDVATVAGGATAYTDSGLGIGALRLYRLGLYVGGSVVGYSQIAWGTTGEPVTTIATIQRCYAVRQPDGGARLYWEHRFGDVARFRIEGQIGTGAWTYLADAPADVTAAVVADTDRFQALNLRIRPESASVAGAWTTVPGMQAAPYAVGTYYLFGYTPSAATVAPSGLSAQRIGPGAIRLTWTGSADTVLRSLGTAAWHSAAYVGGKTGTTIITAGHGLSQRFALTNAGGWSNVVEVAALARDPNLPPASDVQVTPTTATTAVVAWSWSGSGATGFYIEHTDSPYAFVEVGPGVRSVTMASNYSSDKAYRVWARSANGWSQPGLARTSSAPLGTPTGLTATSVAATSVTLSWTAAPGTYINCLQRAEGAGPWRDLGPAKTATYTDLSVVPGTTYRYRVSTQSDLPYGNEITVAVPAPTAAPAAVTGLTVTGVAPGQINVAWSAVTTATTFTISTSPDGTVWTTAATLPGDARFWRLTGLTAGTTRQVRVVAGNAAGSAAAVIASATTPTTAPTPVVVVKTSPIGGWRLLNVTGTAADDDIEIAQSGTSILVRSGGTTISTQAGPFAEIRVSGGDGNDRLRIDGTVTGRAALFGGTGDDTLIADGLGVQTVIALGQGRDSISGRIGVVDYWIDRDGIDTATVAAADETARRVHRVLRFDRDVDINPIGQNQVEPGTFTGMGQARLPDQPMWGDGPGALDINQGSYQDCPMTSFIQEFAMESPTLLQQLAVDLGDGTYALAIEGGHARVDGDFTLNYLAKTPPSGQVWALVLEKAMVVYGNSMPLWTQRRSTWVELDNLDAETAYRQFRTALNGQRAINIFTRSDNLLDFDTGCPTQHAHSMLGAHRSADGTPRFIVRNPYGTNFEKNTGLTDWRVGLRVMTWAQLSDMMASAYIVARSDVPEPAPIADPGTATVAAGQSVAIRLRGYDADNLPLTWTITGMPTRGVLSGTAPYLIYTPSGPAAGNDAITCTIGNGITTSAPATIAITITGTSATVPAITTQPANVTVTAGGTASVIVAASGSPAPTIQWQRNLSGTWTSISGATNATYSLTTVIGDNGAQFRAVATNSAGSATSNVATLTVNPANTTPTITAIGNQTVNEDSATTSMAFTVGDGQTPPGSLLVTAVTSNPTLVPTGGIAVSGLTASRTVIVTPAANQNGTATITLTVSDGQLTATTAFTVTVTAVNDPPVNSALPTISGTPQVGQTQSVQAGTWNDATDNGSIAGFAYQWQRADSTAGANLANITGATAATYVAVVADQGKVLRVQVTATDVGAPAPGVSTSALTAWTAPVAAASVVPAFTIQPATATVIAGSDATFTVAASGTPAPTIQWQRNLSGTWTNISGATSASYTLTTVIGDNGAQFRAVATNSAGSATSAVATLTVNPVSVVPTITTQPANVTVTAGSSATFTVAASGTPAPTIQWQRNISGTWTNISGATSASYTLTTVIGDNGAQFRAVATNSAGSATSAVATLTVNPVPVVPTITTQPVNVTVTAGSSATFTVGASGTPAPTIQWQRNLSGTWTNISGATSASYILTTVIGDNGAQFRAVATNSAGSTTSAVATLTVNPLPAVPTITTQPVNVTVTAGSSATFTVGASGTPAPTIQWQRNLSGIWTNISGATSASYILSTVIGDNGAQFRAVATNSAGSATSTVATLTVNPVPAVPTITTQPVNVTVTAGSSATFTVGASGTPAPTILWQRNVAGTWTNISGATSGTYTLSTVIGDNGAQFRAVATNSVGSATTNVATLSVNTVTTGTGLLGTYFATMQLTGPSQTRLDAQVAFDWMISSPLAGMPTDGFSVRWTGSIVVPVTETVTFYTLSDDGVRLWVNGQSIVNNWTDHGTMENAGSIVLTAGVRYAIVMEYYENSGGAVAKLLWSSATLAKGLIPQANLYSDAGTAPVILSQSTDLAVTAGASASFTVTTSGSPTPMIQWQRNISGTWTNISGATSASYTLTTVIGDNGAQFRAVATNSAGSATSAVATLTVRSAMAVPWIDSDVGGVGKVGSALHQGPVGSGEGLTVTGSGDDIWNQADAFHFVSQPITGDVTIIARVVSQTNTDAWAKAGVMLRDDGTAGSRHAFMAVTPGNGMAFQRRTITSGSSASTAGSGTLAPRWVRLIRSGTTVTAAESADGVTWTTVGTTTWAMGASLQVGLAVTAHNNNALSTAVFDSVQVIVPGRG